MNERSQACAACKHQRRKCHKNCLLAPYFPSGQHEDFMNAHKLFGVSNITKILNQIEPDQRTEAIKSILIESKARREDPVRGIVGIILKLRSEIQVCEAELNIVKQQLAYYQQLICRQQQKEQIEQLQSQQQLLGFLASSSSTTSSPLLQMPALLDSANNNKPYTESDTLNQGCTHSTTQEYGDVKPLDDKTTSQRKKAHIKFKDAGRNPGRSAEPAHKEKQLAN